MKKLNLTHASNFKSYINEKYLALAIMLSFSSPAFAADANPFDKVIKILDFITEALTTQIATAVIGLCVIVGGFLALKGRIPWAWFGAVLTAAVIISGGSWIAQLFMTGEG